MTRNSTIVTSGLSKRTVSIFQDFVVPSMKDNYDLWVEPQIIGGSVCWPPKSWQRQKLGPVIGQTIVCGPEFRRSWIIFEVRNARAGWTIGQSTSRRSASVGQGLVVKFFPNLINSSTMLLCLSLRLLYKYFQPPN